MEQKEYRSSCRWLSPSENNALSTVACVVRSIGPKITSISIVDLFPECSLDIQRLQSHIEENPNANQISFNLQDESYEDCIVEIDGALLKELRQRFRLTSTVKLQIPLSSVSPVRFYNKAAAPQEQIWKEFPKQDMAFEYFDKLSPTQRHDVKIFQYEAFHSGKRKFLVASMSKFSDMYLSVSHDRRHVYEIIREGFPCRMYFDLEYCVATNPTTHGDALVQKWIHLVLWKLHSMYGLCIGSEHVVVLDSSTADKFSKHVIIQLFSQQHHSGQGICGAPRGREVLFANNAIVKNFVDSLVQDITVEVSLGYILEAHRSYTESHAEPDGAGLANDAIPLHQGDQPSTAPSNRHVPTLGAFIPKPQYADLWVTNASGDKKMCFADLSVYSRNRMFRIFMSSKFGKKAKLTLSMADKRMWGGFSPVDGSGSSLCLPMTREAMQKSLLSRSFVVPYDIMTVAVSSASLKRKSDVLDMAGQGVSELSDNAAWELAYPVLDLSHTDPAISLCDLQLGGTGLIASRLPRSRFTGPHWVSGGAGARVQAGSGSDEWRKRELMHSTLPKQASPFPTIDKYITLNHASLGGIRGFLEKWSVYGMPSPSSHGSDGVAVAPSSPGGAALPGLRIKYTIGNNRYCKNVQRHHKSNQIMVDVDLVRRTVTQSCWDPDCRGFRSAPINIPSGVSIDSAAVKQYQNLFIDKLVLAMLEKGEVP